MQMPQKISMTSPSQIHDGCIERLYSVTIYDDATQHVSALTCEPEVAYWPRVRTGVTNQRAGPDILYHFTLRAKCEGDHELGVH